MPGNRVYVRLRVRPKPAPYVPPSTYSYAPPPTYTYAPAPPVYTSWLSARMVVGWLTIGIGFVLVAAFIWVTAGWSVVNNNSSTSQANQNAPANNVGNQQNNNVGNPPASTPNRVVVGQITLHAGDNIAESGNITDVSQQDVWAITPADALSYMYVTVTTPQDSQGSCLGGLYAIQLPDYNTLIGSNTLSSGWGPDGAECLASVQINNVNQGITYGLVIAFARPLSYKLTATGS